MWLTRDPTVRRQREHERPAQWQAGYVYKPELPGFGELVALNTIVPKHYQGDGNKYFEGNVSASFERQ